MITYNSNDTLQEAYKNWNQKIWDLTYTMVSTASYRENEHKKKELLIWNYPTEESQTLEEFFV
jgi:archaellum component FlaF (FlaF/FlaG flagellin family)